jgi:hypothetical protein
LSGILFRDGLFFNARPRAKIIQNPAQYDDKGVGYIYLRHNETGKRQKYMVRTDDYLWQPTPKARQAMKAFFNRLNEKMYLAGLVNGFIRSGV